MNRENKKKSFEKNHYKTHPCNETFTCKVCGKTVVQTGAGSNHRNHCPYYLEALETRPDFRGKGYASLLLSNVLDVLRKDGPFRICDCVSKKNTASLKVHENCGFQIVSENGYDYLQNEEDDHDFGLEYRYSEE